MNMRIEVENEALLQRVKDNDGYCICALVHNPDTKCMCKEFRETIPTTDGEIGRASCRERVLCSV